MNQEIVIKQTGTLVRKICPEQFYFFEDGVDGEYRDVAKAAAELGYKTGDRVLFEVHIKKEK